MDQPNLKQRFEQELSQSDFIMEPNCMETITKYVVVVG